jgi:multicomponent Na+:H+ antiporter subunit C
MFGEEGLLNELLVLLNELLVERFNYCVYVVLLLIGLYAMIAKNNLIKKLIGMSIFQTAIILFYISIGVKEGATIPIYLAEHDPHGHHAEHTVHLDQANATDVSEDNATSLTASHEEDHGHHGPRSLTDEETSGYANPLPHVLMLTAIVVGVATLGVALALTQRIYRAYGTIEEDAVLAATQAEESATVIPDVLATKPKQASAKSRKAKKA